MDQLLRVMNFNVSSDGIGAGEHQSLERPFGCDHPERLFAWAGATASWPMRTDPGGSRGLDDYFTRDFARNIGAEIMGRNKFGPQRGPWQDFEWRGWWGQEPPFGTPVFVMTHHTRPSFTLSDTTFHFVDADPASVQRGTTSKEPERTICAGQSRRLLHRCRSEWLGRQLQGVSAVIFFLAVRFGRTQAGLVLEWPSR